FNRFYHQERILSETPEATRAKLVLVAACAKVIRSGLTVLGLQSPRQI
ncbi:hypothetical protein K0U00_45085, partial [Paenibacillus sepulcri]|nr:hypothetical protein [Paenibacillus sepulcri]